MLALYEYMHISKSCEVGTIIPKKQLYANMNVSREGQTLITGNVAKMIWQYSFNPSTIAIKPYKDEIREYPEIEIIEVSLNSTSANVRKIADLIMRAIPYPMLLVFTAENQIQLWSANQRTNLADSSKNTIEEFIETNWINLALIQPKEEKFLKQLDVNELSFADFYQFYCGFVDRIIVYNASLFTDNELDLKYATKIKERYYKILELQKQINEMKSIIYKEKQFNRKVELNMKIKKLRQELDICVIGLG